MSRLGPVIGSIFIIALCAVSPVAGSPVEMTEQLSVQVGQERTIEVPISSTMQGWKVVEFDRQRLEIRSQQTEPDHYRITIAGIAAGNARLVLQMAFSLPPYSTLERRIYDIAVTGGPVVADRATAPLPAASVAPSTAPARPVAAVAPPPAAAAPAAAVNPAPAPVTNRPRRNRVIIQEPEYVFAPGELVNGLPRQERLDTVKKWVAVAEELRDNRFFTDAVKEYAGIEAFTLPEALTARVLMGEVDCQVGLADREQALELLGRILADYQKTSYYHPARLRTGQLLMEEKKYTEALREFYLLDEEIGNAPLAREGRFNQAQCYYELLRFDDALAEYKGLLNVENRPAWRSRIAYEIARIYDFIPALRDYYLAIDYYRRVAGGEYGATARSRIKHIQEEYL